MEAVWWTAYLYKYLSHIVEVIDDAFGYIDDYRNCSSLVLNSCFFIMVKDKINVIWQNAESSPENKSIDPPTYSVSVLF